ncbi:MAG: SGNH/GDSL hydrolase family protein [Ruminococcaceae bacterium]|nr:SGNH/GDSL hydrolase family protein [Oscillospiraceae bacterium]
MRLDFETVRKITFGAVRVCLTGGNVCFYKMTERQLEAYRALSEGLYNNAANTTGVRLDFWTDSPYVAFLPASEGKYEVKIDGLLASFGCREVGKECRITLPEDGHSHRVTLCLPCHGSGGMLSYVELADGALVTPHVFDMRMLFIGDSITQGWNSEYDSFAYAPLVADHFNAESIVQGVGGACYEPSTVEKLDFSPDTVIVAYGTNDAGDEKILSVLDGKCRETLEKIKVFYPDARIVVITPIWRQDQDVVRAYGHVRCVAECIASVATSLGIEVIDGLTLVPHVKHLFVDNVHPNDLGFALYAHNLIKALERD